MDCPVGPLDPAERGRGEEGEFTLQRCTNVVKTGTEAASSGIQTHSIPD